MRSTLQRVCELILSIKDNKTLWQQIQIWFQATINRNFRWSSLSSGTMSSCQVLNSSRASEMMKREKRLENSALNMDFSFWKFHDANWRGRSVASMEAQVRMGESRIPIVFSWLSLWRPSQKGLISRGTVVPLGSSCSCWPHQWHPASTRLAWTGQRCELDAHLNSP